MKKTILVAVVILFFGLAPIAFAEGFVALAPIPGLTKDIAANTQGLATFFNNLYRFAIGMAAVLAVIQIIWGGIEIAVNKDNVSKIIDSKGRILQAILGLVLVLSPVLVFSIINPSILNLSINLRELQTTTGSPSQPTGTGTVAATDTSSGCVVNGISGILQIAVCPSDAAARTWGQGCNNALDVLSPITQTSSANPTTGIASVKNVIACTTRQLSYIFINTDRTFRAINSIQPLVHTSARPNNAANAISFANICQSAGLGWKTCISDVPSTVSARRVDCQLTRSDPSYGTTWKCYEENLSCENRNIVFNNQICADGPEWAPFR
jgi:hypothetical protein